ncbi:MAG TPA: DivIVA domain-containing protein [Oceanithermus profundus]|uniref:DivIVA domain-containing protein n=1 Tax=Oceanithermus profundus TaxID=187137 RepID=A0A7C4Z7A2_9DEIN|nr:DivIVA domain-containing protein [Oceanithermus profundus]
MEFNSLDIRYQEFKRGLRGYAVEEVRAYLAQLADYVAELVEARQQLEQQLAELEESLQQHRKNEEELKRAVVAAERIARDVKQQAQREAELILKEAQGLKEQTLREVVEHVKRVQRDLDVLRRERDLFKEQFRALLEGYLKSLDNSGD